MRFKDIQEAVGRITKQNQTVDVGPNEISKQAKKFGNTVDKDGRPPTLSKKVKGSKTNVLYNLGLTEGIMLKFQRGEDFDTLHIKPKGKNRVELRGKPGYERGNHDPQDKLHQVLDKLGKAANFAELMNGETVSINPKHPDGERATKTAQDILSTENACPRTRAASCQCESVNKVTEAQETMTAVCVLEHSDEVEGTILFKQQANEPTLIVGKITGLEPGEHGFHIHEFGDLSQGCESAGAHYNPDGVDHGDLDEGHVGDLGNITADSSGTSSFEIVAKRIDLLGERSVVGRAVVVHKDEDDLGKGGDAESLKTGNAGERLACGVITLKETVKESVFEDIGELANASEIYVDMDGVLADFFGSWKNLIGKNWRNIDDIEPALQKIRDTDNFWLDLPLTNNAQNLLNLIKDVKGEYKILSSPLPNDPNSEPHKREWIKKNLNFFPPKDVIITHDKPKFATQQDGTPNILIDDYGKNIQSWEAAGGVGFKHKDHKFERTAKNIKQHMREPVKEGSMVIPPSSLREVIIQMLQDMETDYDIKKLADIARMLGKEVYYKNNKVVVQDPDFDFYKKESYSREQLPQLREKNLKNIRHTMEWVRVEDLIPVQEERILENFKRQVDRIVAGKYNPIIVDCNNKIVNGHHRYEAAKLMGYNEMAVAKLPFTIKQIVENFADGKKKGKSIGEGPQDFDDMNLDGNKLQQSLDYFYKDHAPIKIGGRKEAGSFKGYKVVTFTKAPDTLMFLVNKNDQAVFYVGYITFKDGVAVGNVRSNGKVRATEVYAYLVDKFGTLYSDNKQTPQGRKIWSDLAKFFPDIEVTDTGDRLQATKESIEENFADGKKNEARTPRMNPADVIAATKASSKPVSQEELQRIVNDYKSKPPNALPNLLNKVNVDTVINIAMMIGAPHLNFLQKFLVKKGIKFSRNVMHKALAQVENIEENFADGKVNFTMPDFDYEWEEANRYEQYRKIGKEEWIKLAKTGEEVDVDNRMANDIENTEAGEEYRDDHWDGLVKAKRDRFAKALSSGQIELPIIARYSDGQLELISGNTRLTGMMRELGKAKAWIYDVPDEIADLEENFADGKKKGKSRPGRVKRAGASCDGSVTELRRKAKNASGERAKMYHWCANMKAGRQK